jgi:hypothetical protein
MSRHQRCAGRNCGQTSFAPAFFDSLVDEGPEVRDDARRTADSIIRWVRRIPARFSLGSERPAVPIPPTRPKRPGTEERSTRLVSTPRRIPSLP